jgi:hypothetical protein
MPFAYADWADLRRCVGIGLLIPQIMKIMTISTIYISGIPGDLLSLIPTIHLSVSFAIPPHSSWKSLLKIMILNPAILEIYPCYLETKCVLS